MIVDVSISTDETIIDSTFFETTASSFSQVILSVLGSGGTSDSEKLRSCSGSASILNLSSCGENPLSGLRTDESVQ
jgi:hypothetical protein